MSMETTRSYGIMTRILSEAKARVSDPFAPTRLLDVGCGSGSSSLLVSLSFLT